MKLEKLFLSYCKKNNLEINPNQIALIKELNDFYNTNFDKSFLNKIFAKKNIKQGFYLQGDVGVGKTMILNFFYDNFDYSKDRFHFNEFMIGFHDFVFEHKENDKEAWSQAHHLYPSRRLDMPRCKGLFVTSRPSNRQSHRRSRHRVPLLHG